MAKKNTKSPKAPQDQIYTLHVSLENMNPPVWRRVMVPGSFTLEALHSILQMTFGWQMSHQYDFVVGKKRFAEPTDFDDKPVASVATSISAALEGEESFTYNYDFGDDWRHTVKVEKIVPRESIFHYPICVGGENACPPEDCGGFPGYEDIKEKIANPKHPEHREAMQWLGGYFDPHSFDPNRINRDFLWLVDWDREPNDQGLYLPFNADDDISAEHGSNIQ